MKKLAILAGLLGLAALIFVPTLLKNHGIYLFTYWLIYVIATMGLNLTIGYAGQKSLGHAAFFGIGAYVVAIMMQAGHSFWLGMPLAALGCFVVGLALAFLPCVCKPFTWPLPHWGSTPPSGWSCAMKNG